MSVGEAGWRLGITRREYVALEGGERPPSADEYEAICAFFGWPDAMRAVPSQATSKQGRSSRVRTRRSGGCSCA